MCTCGKGKYTGGFSEKSSILHKSVFVQQWNHLQRAVFFLLHIYYIAYVGMRKLRGLFFLQTLGFPQKSFLRKMFAAAKQSVCIVHGGQNFAQSHVLFAAWPPSLWPSMQPKKKDNRRPSCMATRFFAWMDGAMATWKWDLIKRVSLSVFPKSRVQLTQKRQWQFRSFASEFPLNFPELELLKISNFIIHHPVQIQFSKERK